MDKGNVPPPADEEEIAYIYNARTQTVHKWPGCRGLKLKRYPSIYWTPHEFGEAIREFGAIHRCRLCFGRPT